MFLLFTAHCLCLVFSLFFGEFKLTFTFTSGCMCMLQCSLTVQEVVIRHNETEVLEIE